MVTDEQEFIMLEAPQSFDEALPSLNFDLNSNN
jgi:hypothetical protein